MGASLPQLPTRCLVFAAFQTLVRFLVGRKFVLSREQNPGAATHRTAACRLVAGDDLIWGK